MVGREFFRVVGGVLFLIAMAALLLIPGCYEEKSPSQGSTVINPTQATTEKIKPLPQRGKQRLAAAPTYAVFGMIYINTSNNREYIYDGAQWVPHDQTVDGYYSSIDSRKAKLAVTASEVFPTGTPPTPTGAHGLPDNYPGGPTQHGKYACRVCHLVGGVLAFDPNGPAVAPGNPLLPSFDAITKTCSNVACHGVPSGTFSYYFPGNEMDEEGYPIPELKTVTVLGNSGGTTPSWYATGSVACSACHLNPPLLGTNGSNAWHSGSHANNQNVGPIGPNACELCHNKYENNVFSPIAQSSNGVGTAILIPALHGNGVYDVVARFRSQCFGCH